MAALRAGVAPHIVSKRLGHADVATTLSIYSHVFVADDETAAEVMRRPSSVRGQTVITAILKRRDLRKDMSVVTVCAPA